MVSSTVGVEVEGPETEFNALDFPDPSPSRAEPVSSAQIVEKPERLTDPTEAKKGPPKLEEWQDFFARFLIRIVIDAYLAFALGDLMEDLTKMELESIMLSKEDMQSMAAPFATVAHGSSFGRRHGRSIIALADSYESLINFLFWMRRVNRIARKHGGKPKRQKQQRNQRNQRQQTISQGVNNAGNDGYSSAESSGAGSTANGVIFNPNFG